MYFLFRLLETFRDFSKVKTHVMHISLSTIKYDLKS